MMMHGRQPPPFARFLDFEPRSEPRLVGGAQSIDVDTNARADFPCSLASMTQEHRHGSVGLPRHDPGRQPHCLAAITKLEDVFIIDSELLSQSWTQERGIVPREFRERLGQLLEPAIVGPAAVADRRIRAEHDFECVRAFILRRREGDSLNLG